eukprot:jgi/Tetstr1/457812/TSEL_044357.t1
MRMGRHAKCRVARKWSRSMPITFCSLLRGLLLLAALSTCRGRLDKRCIPSRTEPELRELFISYGQTHERSSGFMRHLDRVKLLQTMEELQLVFYGDSIANRMNRLSPSDWHSLYGSEFNALALGIGGDRTENVLWRITHGEFAQSQNPQFVVLVMGINNILHKFRDLDRDDDDNDGTGDMPERYVTELVDDITLHVKEIAAFIHQNSCRTQVVFQAILPSAEELVNWIPNRQTRVADAVNRSVKELTKQYSNLHFYDCGDDLLTPDGQHIDDELMPDLLHPTNDGYKAMAPCIKDNLYRITRDLLSETAHTEWGECSKRCGGGSQTEICSFGADFPMGLHSDDSGSTQGAQDWRQLDPELQLETSSEEYTSSDMDRAAPEARDSEDSTVAWDNYAAFLDQEDYEEDYTVYQSIVLRDVPRYAMYEILDVENARAEAGADDNKATSAARPAARAASTMWASFALLLAAVMLVYR